MNKKEQSLVEKFKKLEAELLQVLSESKVQDLDLEQNKSVVKSQLRVYVKKVEKAGKLFDEYEKVAEQIEQLTQTEAGDANKKASELADAVVGLRETEELKQEYVDEIDASANMVKVVKKKKNNSSAKEF